MIYRLYLVDRKTEKSTGKKRDYVSDEHFKKHGIDTYTRYNVQYSWWTGKESETKAKLCYLDDNNKWVETTEEMRKDLGL